MIDPTTLQQVFDKAVELPPGDRRAYLDQSCSGDTALRQEVERLLAAYERLGSVFDSQAARASASPTLMESVEHTMSLASGTRLGPYVISSAIGRGGMGEVYKSRDTRLDRTVAIKVLPIRLGNDPDARRRFEREARAVAALNHPHICTLHDIGHQDGLDFLVMEYLEGETLAQRLTRGPLPVDQVMTHARAMADALDKAHRTGIIHRDLKPGNIMLTKAGVKLLDFGLAKPMEAAGLRATTQLATAPTSLTAKGTILGTLQYMAPEQLEGKPTDARTDIFTLGAVIYEMATGRKAFTGTSQASVIAAILDATPPAIATLQPLSPPAVDQIVQTCLAKDPDERWQTAGELKRALRWVADPSAQTSGTAPLVVARKNRAQTFAVLAALATGIALGAFGWNRFRPTANTARAVVRSVIPIGPADTLIRYGSSPLVAMSPDGKYIAYNASRGGTSELYLRSLDGLAPQPIPDTQNKAGWPFFSPDGQWLGFLTLDKSGEHLKKVAVGGGAFITVSKNARGWGWNWGPDGTMVWGHGGLGLWRVSESGGTPQRITPEVETAGNILNRALITRYPEILPDGKAVIYTNVAGVETTLDEGRIEAFSLETGQTKRLVQGGFFGRYAASGHLVYARSRGLYAVPFDAATLTVTGVPVLILEGVANSPVYGAADFSLSRGGTLVYAPGKPTDTNHRLVRVDRSGHVETVLENRAFWFPRVSPDGRRVAVNLDAPTVSHEWVYDFERGTLTQVAGEGARSDSLIAWSPDGRRLAYSVNSGSDWNIQLRSADGSGPVETITRDHDDSVDAWTPDGTSLILERESDIWLLPLEGKREPQRLIHEGVSSQARISPDGHWLAYTSGELGYQNIYVRDFPGLSARTLISTNGGEEPNWSRDGRELFYLEGGVGAKRLMAVTIASQPSFSASRPHLVFDDKEDRYLENGYDVTPDGKFIMVDSHEDWPTQLILVQNWTEELKRKVPTGR